MPFDHLFERIFSCAHEYLHTTTPCPQDGETAVSACAATIGQPHRTSYLVVHSHNFDDWGPTNSASLASCAQHPEDPSCRPFAPDATMPKSASGNTDDKTQIMVGNLPEGTKQIAVILQDGINPTRKPQWLVVGSVNEKWNTRNVAETAQPPARAVQSGESVQFGVQKAAEKLAQCMEEEGFDAKKLMDCTEGCKRFQRVAGAGMHEEGAHGKDPQTDCTVTCQEDSAQYAKDRQRQCQVVGEKEFCHHTCVASCQDSSQKDACQGACEKKCTSQPAPTTTVESGSSLPAFDNTKWRHGTCYDACRKHTRDQCSAFCSHATLQEKVTEVARHRALIEKTSLQCIHTCEHAACLKDAHASVANKHACATVLNQCRHECAAKSATLQADMDDAPPQPPGSVNPQCYHACMNEIPFPGSDVPLPARCQFDCKPGGTGGIGGTLADTFEGTVSTETSHPITFRELEIPYTSAGAGHTDPWIHPRQFRVYALACDPANPFPRAYAARGKEQLWAPPSLQVWQALQRDMRDCILNRNEQTALGVAQAPLSVKAARDVAQAPSSMKAAVQSVVQPTASNNPEDAHDFSQRLEALQATDGSDLTAHYKREVEEE
eukprot:GEMP01023387.1.p1 GENE.GEMP01023387.1~~GEMP01023387.1.p1  ORF type:complete len:606 (+),score=186.53 GEMP01023387.1:184-2001(+)